MRREVSVATAFMSSSPGSLDIEGANRSFCFPLVDRLSLRFSALFSSRRLLACARVPSAILRIRRVSDDFEPLRDRGVALGLEDGATGGSLGLWIVLACFIGGGDSIDVNKFWVALGALFMFPLAFG